MVASSSLRTLLTAVTKTSFATALGVGVGSSCSHYFVRSNMSVKQAKPHVKALTPLYGPEKIRRFPVPDDKIPWNVPYEEYKPTNYTEAGIKNKEHVWADPDVEHEEFKSITWHEPKDGNPPLDRSSFENKYEIVNEVPQNPIGRTGMSGRGILGRWGPNHAADPIVTRWKRDRKGRIICHKTSQKPVLQFVAVKRKDNGEWAIPGGMVDAGRTVSTTVVNEFSEEAVDVLGKNKKKKEKILKEIEEFFSKGSTEIYKGYVDDPRNTDNAWMETVALNFHDEDGAIMRRFALHAGDDAGKVKWEDISMDLKLYASHEDFIKQVASNHHAHW